METLTEEFCQNNYIESDGELLTTIDKNREMNRFGLHIIEDIDISSANLPPVIVTDALGSVSLKYQNKAWIVSYQLSREQYEMYKDSYFSDAFDSGDEDYENNIAEILFYETCILDDFTMALKFFKKVLCEFHYI